MEVAEKGWASLAKMMGKSIPTVWKRKQALLDAGVIFWGHAGTPPRKMIHFFPSQVIRYCAVVGKF